MNQHKNHVKKLNNNESIKKILKFWILKREKWEKNYIYFIKDINFNKLRDLIESKLYF